MSPYALRRRIAHGNVYPDPAKAELALQRFFTMENLTALRELALLKVANQVDDTLLGRWRGPGAAPDVRERVLVSSLARGHLGHADPAGAHVGATGPGRAPRPARSAG